MGILNPAALPFLSLLGVLLLIYLRERRRRRIEVPTLLFWREVQEDTVRAHSFLPDPLFFAQALLLLLLILALLHPYRAHIVTETRGNQQILVFDVSASMQAREGRTRRFELALDQAKQVVQAFGPLDEAMLISVSSRPQLITGFTPDHNLVLHQLEMLQPLDTGTNLDLGLELALAQHDRAGRQGTIHVFTDVPKSALDLTEAQVRSVMYHHVGASDDNLAVTALHIHQNPFQDYAQAQAYVLVRNYAHRSKRATLTVTLNDEAIFHRNFTLPAREATSFSINGFNGPGRLIARLGSPDALAVDNDARGWLAEQRERRLVLVSPVPRVHTELKRVSRAVPGLTLTTLTPESFSAAQLEEQDIVVFHQFVPGPVVPANSLYIFPPPGNPLFPIASDATDLSILDWREGHDILQNLQYVDALPFKTARVLVLPSWAQVLISSRTQSTEVPLALAGEKDGHRVVCLAFDLDKGNLTNSDNMTLLLLFLNTLRWLLPHDPTVPLMVPSGEAFFLPADATPDSLSLLTPDGQRSIIQTNVVEIDHVGEYRLNGSRYQGVLYANLFDEAESDIGRGQNDDEPQPLITTSAKQTHELSHTVPVEFGRWLYYGAALLLFGEWLYALWRYRQMTTP